MSSSSQDIARHSPSHVEIVTQSGDTKSLDVCASSINAKKYPKPKKSVTCHLSPSTCHMLPVTCHLSPVTCPMSPVINTNSHRPSPC